MENVRTSIVLIGLVSLIQVTLGCQNGWEQHGQHCYYFSHDTESFVAAKVKCQDLGAYLVEINNADENKFIGAHATANNTVFYIGLTDLAEEGVWRWYTSHTLPSYTAWSHSEPDNWHGNENCAQIRADQHWGDVPCMSGRHYVCEKPNEGSGVLG